MCWINDQVIPPLHEVSSTRPSQPTLGEGHVEVDAGLPTLRVNRIVLANCISLEIKDINSLSDNSSTHIYNG